MALNHSTDVVAGTNATILHYNNLRNDLKDGWVNPQATVSYSAYADQVGVANISINGIADMQDLFEVGDKIRLKQGGGYLYFVITAVTSNTISFTAGGIYTFANSGVTDFYMSKFVVPADWPLPKNILVTDTDASTVTFNMNVSLSHKLTLGGNRTLAVSNVKQGDYFTVHLKQDASPARTVTWWGSILWYGGAAPTLSTTANAMDSFGFWFDGTNYYGTVIGFGAV